MNFVRTCSSVVERIVDIDEVGGSIPPRFTIVCKKKPGVVKNHQNDKFQEPDMANNWLIYRSLKNTSS